MEFSRQEYWSGLPCPPPGDLPDQGIKPASPALAGGFFTMSATGEALVHSTCLDKMYNDVYPPLWCYTEYFTALKTSRLPACLFYSVLTAGGLLILKVLPLLGLADSQR